MSARLWTAGWDFFHPLRENLGKLGNTNAAAMQIPQRQALRFFVFGYGHGSTPKM